MLLDVTELWRVCDSLRPLPISRTRDRILYYLYELKRDGLITTEEYELLKASDEQDRQPRR